MRISILLGQKTRRLLPLLLLVSIAPLKPLLLGPSSCDDSTQSTTISGILDPFADAQMNSHLLINILDAVVGTILPELLVGGGGVGGGGGLSS